MAKGRTQTERSVAPALVPTTRLEGLGDWVIVRPDDPERVTKAGLHLPEQRDPRPERGRVLAVGPGVLSREGVRLPVPVRPGDHILFSQYGGDTIDLDGVAHRAVRVEHLLAILRD